MTAVASVRTRLLVRSSKHSERPEISGLRGSKDGSRNILVHAYWIAKTLAREMKICGQAMSNSRQPTP